MGKLAGAALFPAQDGKQGWLHTPPTSQPPAPGSRGPPGTSKWNKIEHRLFAFISQNWRGQLLLTHTTIVSLIAATRTQAGLTVRCKLDQHPYPKAVKVTDAQMATIQLTPHMFHGDWNYTIRPAKKRE